MGTRHLIAVYQGGTHKIAQYGQWDGYPEGQGKTVLQFLHETHKVHMLRDYRLKQCKFLTEADLNEIDHKYGYEWAKYYPQMSRNVGAEILNLAAGTDGLALKDSLTFAADSLFCEWCYVIDFDTNSFEIYKGFNTEPAVGRFKDFEIEPGSEYQPVTLIKTYKLDALPTFEQFIADIREVLGVEEDA